ncbi:MAG: thrombospondin type 3 repeat-containing protein, partial [Alphaproteobacteria bacterium]|nr:thrombospondin type 3 repeat-containing protein [Alphaproteobacteria bacterium]
MSVVLLLSLLGRALAQEVCSGGVDEDLDGAVDCADTDCGLDLTCCGGDTSDADGDGWCDHLDVCPSVADPDQADGDGDRVGDACDQCRGNDRRGDTDGDGWCDDRDGCPVVANPLQTDSDGDGTPNACDVCPGDGDGSTLFGSLRRLGSRVGVTPRLPMSADVDGDGDLDLVWVLDYYLDGFASTDIEASLQGASGLEGPRSLWSASFAVTDLVADDLDADGVDDLVFVDGRIRTLGGGISHAFPGTREARVVATGDVDGDGRVDIAYVTARGDLGGFRQTAAGGWSAGMSMPSSLTNPTDLLVVDVDDDGIQDLLASAGDAVAWHRGLGAGVLGARQDLSGAVPGARSLVFEDMDGDGLRDVVALARDANEVVVMRGRGAGAFDAPVAVVTDRVLDRFADGVAVADLDQDGDLDLAVSDTYEVWWHENRGGLVFDAHPALETSATLFREVAAADFDGDGDADLAWGPDWAKNLGQCALADGDQDGLTDAEEVQVFGTDPTARDTDGGGL